MMSAVVLDARTGLLLHTYGPGALRLTRPKKNFSAGNRLEVLAYTGGKLIVGTTTEVFAVELTTGHQYWRVAGGGCGLSVSEGTIFASKSGCQNPCGTSGTWAIELATGRMRWKHVKGSEGSPVVIAGRLVQRSSSASKGRRVNSIHVYDARSGKLLA
ncbi:MAG: hypothetical protein PVSMB7_08440 [Chloroflexota bacterium]